VQEGAVAVRRDRERREEILEATFEEISEKGFSAVTLQDIADRAGVSKGVISYYFENKDEVFLSLLRWVTERIHHKERKAVQRAEGALAKLSAYVNAAFSSPAENRRFYRVYMDFLALGTRDARYRRINEEFYERCWSIGREIVEAGVKEGTFPPQDAARAGYLIRATIDGCLINWLMRDEDRLHETYRILCLETVVAFLRGAASNQPVLPTTLPGRLPAVGS
jgi:TetR/AcrR family fatty acid metabolism transcriptional regulator